MKRIFTILLTILFCGTLAAQSPDTLSSTTLPRSANPAPTGNAAPPRVGLVLGGGGAKGAAHIGVLKYMEEIGIPISYVTGTSMGSIIGGLYALGYSPDEMADLIANMDWSFYMSNTINRDNLSSERREYRNTELLSIPFDLGDMESNNNIISSLPSGAINSSNLLNLFNRLCIGYQDSMSFNDLPIPFACIATDLLTGDSVILSKGEFAKAIRSSMSIPGVFAPVEWGDRLLADGGMVNNFPADVCMSMGADIIIGCEVASKPISRKDSLQSLPQQIMQYLSIATKGNNIENRKKCRIYISPDVTGYNMLSFSTESIYDLVQRGYRQAQKHEAEFRALKAEIEKYGSSEKHLQAPRATNLMPGQLIQLGEVNYHGASPSEVRRLLKLHLFEEGAIVDVNNFETAVSRLRGSGNYLYVHYKLRRSDNTPASELSTSTHSHTYDTLHKPTNYERYDADIHLIPTKPHSVGLGFRFDSEESAAILFHLGFNEQRVAGFKAFLDLKLAYNFSLTTRFSWSATGLGEVDFDYRYRNTSFRIMNLNMQNIWNNRFRLYYTNRHLNHLTFKAGIQQDNYIDADIYLWNRTFQQDNSDPLNSDNQWLLGLFADINYDNMDDNFFANRGINFNVRATLFKDNKVLFDPSLKPDVAFFASWKNHIPVTSTFNIIPQLSGRVLLSNSDYSNSVMNLNYVGGAFDGRYVDHQIAFFGYNFLFWASEAYAPTTSIGLARLDFRYQLSPKNYISLIANGYVAFAQNYEMGEFEPTGNYDEEGNPIEEFVSKKGFLRNQNFGIGLRLAHKSFLGPIFLDIAWNTRTHSLFAFINVGHFF